MTRIGSGADVDSAAGAPSASPLTSGSLPEAAVPRKRARSGSRPSPPPPHVPAPRIVRSLSRLLRRVLLVLLGLYLLCALGLVYLRFFPPLVTMVQLQRIVEAMVGPEPVRRRMTWVSAASLPAYVPHAVVAAEDARFYQHHGFDWVEVRHTMEQIDDGGRPRGASTITQQLVKNLFLTTHRSFIRKGAELALTPLAELILPKRRILELYLNVVEWGPGVYGIDEGAKLHYHTRARRLTREQSARLAAILPAPRRRKPDRMGWYSAIIQSRMRQMGW